MDNQLKITTFAKEFKYIFKMLRIAVQSKGRLYDDTMRLLAKSGMEISLAVVCLAENELLEGHAKFVNLVVNALNV